MLPGRDINDLLVGDAGMPETPTQNLDGLRLTETAGIGSHASGAADVVSDDDGWTEIEEEIEEEVAAEDALPGGFEGATGDEIDDDIRDVFIEEVEEELANLRQQVPAWKRDVDNFDELKAIRRSFHTLKGSGRLVGALALGEFSWKVEGLLNRVLERSVVASPAVMALVDHAVNAIPVLLSALRGETVGEANIAGIMQTADQLAAGEEAWVPERRGATRTVRRSVRRRVRIAPSGLPSFGADIRSSGNLNGETDFSSATHDLVAGPLPNIDPVLFDILQSEVASHLGVIEDYLRLSKPDAIPATEPLLRAVHTLSGAIAMVDIPTIGNVLAPLENYIKRLRGADVVPSPDAIGALHDTIALTRDVMQRLDARDAQLPDSTALATQITALRDSLPETDATLAWYSEVADVPAALDEQSDEGVIADVDDTDVDDAPPVEIDIDDELPAPPLPPVEDFTGDWLSELGDSAEAARIEPIHAPIPADLAASLAGFELPEPPAESHEEVPAVDHDSAFEASFGVFPASIESDALDAVEEHLASAPADVPLEDDLQAALDALEVEDATADAESPAVTPDIAPRLPLGGREAPPLADDPQPEGALELIDVDDDLLDIFVQESADILDHSDTLVARLREAPHERNAMVGLQRDLHTLKGGAHMAGLTPIGDLSHAMESLVDAVSDGRLAVDRVAVESLERGFDRLHVLVQRVAQRRAIGMPTHAIARFESLVAGEDVHVSKAPVADEAAVMPAAETPSAPEASSELEPKRPAPRHLTAMDQEEAPHAPQEMIRVRSDLLDSLVNYAGEVSIYRSRLEQQISTFRFNLVEFDQTVARLREQLRKLEIETEAQIIARFQREQQQEGVFDPLELDRFSQLQQLSRALGESVSDLVSIQGLLDDQTRQSETLLLQQSRVSSDLQEGLMRTRMVPFDSLVPNLRRTLRQAAHELGKRAQLKVDGAHGEMDRNLLERMKAPFEHMLRNALAHGIETPEAREAAGKPAEGTVNIAVSRESTEVVLRVSDDGRGMDRDAIRKQAIERGLLKPEVELPDRDLYGFVLETGFSTARELTQLAGRGVGMDVVHTEIKQLGGSLLIDSTVGKGTSFTIRLPFTLAVTQAILVKLGESSYAVPMSSVQGVARIARDDLERRVAEGNPKHHYAGEEYAIYDLAQLLGIQRARAVAGDDVQVPLLMTRTGDQRAAVRIDGVIGSREIVVKSVGPQLSSVAGIFGATIMGDGSVVIILDLAPLVRRLAALRARIDAGTEVAPAHFDIAPEITIETRQKPLVMVVDDSITMRKVTTRVLERADFDVITAKDGLDALEKLQDTVPDLMLLDIEMPRMDGYELATYMRNDSRLRKVPIIMITSRTGEKHRQRALEIGVERYLGKPYQEDDLLREVQDVLRQERV
jgi:chemosensory pili system protein ChpA (sensor histidine kinase/response regulator)